MVSGALLRRFVHALVDIVRLLLYRALQSAGTLYRSPGGRCHVGSVHRRGARATRSARTGRLGLGLRARQQTVSLQHFLGEDRDDHERKQQADEPEPAALAMKAKHVSSRNRLPMRKKSAARPSIGRPINSASD